MRDEVEPTNVNGKQKQPKRAKDKADDGPLEGQEVREFSVALHDEGAWSGSWAFREVVNGDREEGEFEMLFDVGIRMVSSR